MLFTKKKIDKPLIKNVPQLEKKADFTLNAVGLAFLALLIIFALALRVSSGNLPSIRDFIILLATPLVASLAMVLFPRWSVSIKLLLLCLIALAFTSSAMGGEAPLVFAFAAVALIFAPSIQKMEEWERAVVLRFGRFHRVHGPGLFILIPFADRIAKVVDLRIRVTDFATETTLTRDSVTVTVDAICFWMVWDAEKAVCEVQDYVEAVVLSSKTALRNMISKNDLSTFLEHGDEIEEKIREEVDKKTTEWGLTVQHIEITDIQIPLGLQDSLSRLAQMEREKNGRILLAEAEIDIANKFKEASKIYGDNETAMKLKSLSILNEGLKAGNSMMLVPNSITEELKTKDLFGLQALNEIKLEAKTKSPRQDKAK